MRPVPPVTISQFLTGLFDALWVFPTRRAPRRAVAMLWSGTVIIAAMIVAPHPLAAQRVPEADGLDYQPRPQAADSSLGWRVPGVRPWTAQASLQDIAQRFREALPSAVDGYTKRIEQPNQSPYQLADAHVGRSNVQLLSGDADKAYRDLVVARQWIESDSLQAKQSLYSIIYLQGVAALRQGENDNCIMCRGESSCILPIAPAAMHKNPIGSRMAIRHFKEYLAKFPDDLEVRWLLNVAYMTLGQYPEKVPAEFLVSIDLFLTQEHSIGKFRDIGDVVGVNRFNQGGGGIMDDFDNDGLLDIVASSFDATQEIGVYFNDGKGRFVEGTGQAGVADQLGGLNCVQTDYNNDGLRDLFILRGAWLPKSLAIRSSLLRNNGNRTFTDVTSEAGLDAPCNTIAAAWQDFDNDGWLDVFVCCEQQPSRLFRNRGNGTFEEVAAQAGVAGTAMHQAKGATWIDFDNDRYADLFVNHLSEEGGQLFHNQRDGTFRNVTEAMGILGPYVGFSCMTMDVNNDGYQDILATCYHHSVAGAVKGLVGQPHGMNHNRLYINQAGKGFIDVAAQAGLDQVFVAMGSNFADFDNDGFLDVYLGTGDPMFSTLVPNRMLRNLEGKRFVDITASSGTGNLQKGHGVACGDWDRNGTVDLFIQMGGAVKGDRYHNILFQNPGNPHAYITLQLEGTQSNKGAVGTRIKIQTAGPRPQVIHRHVSSGSSFGGNPFEQTIGLGQATAIDLLEIQWPASDTVQQFRNLPIGQVIKVVEGAESYAAVPSQPIVVAAK
jgi:hypothetical protein